jgi:hypothetical protein
MNALVPTGPNLVDRSATVESLGVAVSSASDLELALWVLVFWTLVLDIGLTVYGLSVGLVERNPVMRHALDAVGLTALLVAKAAAVAIALGFRMAWPEYAIVAPLGLAVPWALAVVYNATLLASL